MTYLMIAFSDLMMLTSGLIINDTVSVRVKNSVRYISAIVISVILSATMIYCNAQQNSLCKLIALLIYPLRYLTVLLILYGRLHLKNIYVFVIYEFLINTILSSLTNFIGDFISLSHRELSAIILILINTSVIILLIIFRVKISGFLRSIIGLIPKHIYILVLCSIICLSVISSINNYPTSYQSRKENVLNIIIVVFSLITAYIIISLLVNVIARQHFRSTTAMLQNQVEIQIRHYDKLEKLNNEMRSFRHDYTNHLYSLLSLIKMDEPQEAVEYIEKLLLTKHTSHMEFCTGNKLADAILTDKSDLLPENITIDYQGIIPPAFDNLDLCVILSNSLDNAIEACGYLDSAGVITISAMQRQGYFVLTITNPTVNNGSFSDIPATSKSDPENHGMGLTNISDIVRKYDGQMQVHCKDQVFELSLILKI